MKHLRIIFVALAISLLAGCYTSQDRGLVGFSRLKSGMTEVELKGLLGEPKQVEAKGNFVVWTYSEGTVIMQQGLVFSWEVGDVRR
jgi:outer membrane protein assembly factor BamE (lipoprotein component of BamABCDE complex)